MVTARKLRFSTDWYPMQSAENPNTEGAPTSQNLFERVGQEPFFVTLVERFYALVAEDPVLRPMYSPNLESSKAHLAAFLAQYWGGLPRYTLERGHPRLGMRHAQFSIGQAERDAWVSHMTAAVQTMEVSPEDAATLIVYFERTATFLKNQP